MQGTAAKRQRSDTPTSNGCHRVQQPAADAVAHITSTKAARTQPAATGSAVPAGADSSCAADGARHADHEAARNGGDGPRWPADGGMSVPAIPQHLLDAEGGEEEGGVEEAYLSHFRVHRFESPAPAPRGAQLAQARCRSQRKLQSIDATCHLLLTARSCSW